MSTNKIHSAHSLVENSHKKASRMARVLQGVRFDKGTPPVSPFWLSTYSSTDPNGQHKRQGFHFEFNNILYHLFRSRAGIGQKWLPLVPFAISVINHRRMSGKCLEKRIKIFQKSLMQSLLSFLRYAFEIFSVGDKNIFRICGIRTTGIFKKTLKMAILCLVYYLWECY